MSTQPRVSLGRQPRVVCLNHITIAQKGALILREYPEQRNSILHAMSERGATGQSHPSAGPVVEGSFEARLERPTEPEIYKHQLLDTSKDEIRLLKLSRETDGPVHCEVKVFPFECAPKYIALSYRWGPPLPLHDLYIEGKTLKIREILNSGLLELREDLEAWLWIDQICIAQEDTLERNHQVGMMSRIYSNSMSVIIWIGEIPLAAPEEHDSYNDPDLDVASAKVLLKNPYFTRLWIIQEVFLANSISIRINGHRCVTWDRLQSLFIAPTDFLGISSIYVPHFLVAFAPKWKGTKVTERYMSLMDCVSRFSSAECENPRDKVYGLLSMVHEEDRVVVDYEKSVLEVYLGFIQININKKLSLDTRSIGIQDNRGRFFVGLGVSIGIEDDIISGIERLVQNRFLHHSQDTVTAVGLEKVGQAHEQHQWWYECNGERHRFSCLPLSDSEIAAFVDWD